MTKVYERTEDGATTRVTVRDALAEVNHSMMNGKREVRTMSSGRGRHDIEYKDGRHVVLVETAENKAPTAQNLRTHTGAVHAPGRSWKALGGQIGPKCAASSSAAARWHFLIPTGDAITCRRCLAAIAKETTDTR